MATTSMDKKSSNMQNNIDKEDVKGGQKSYESTPSEGVEVSNQYGTANKDEDIKNASLNNLKKSSD